MIDYEFRIITPILCKIKKIKDKREKFVNAKLPLAFFSKKKQDTLHKKYLTRACRLKQIVISGFPLNNKDYYFKQENEILNGNYDYLKKYNNNLKFLLTSQIPNPKFVRFSEFMRFQKKIKKKVFRYELNCFWHKNNFLDKIYKPFLNFINKNKHNLFLELDYIFRSSSVFDFFKLVNKYPNINYYLPHFGCGAFLHWNKFSKLNKRPSLLTSSGGSLEWFNFFEKGNLKKTRLLFASDHPFNKSSSIKIYNRYLKYCKI
jgi:hypothetical protein